MGSARWAFPPSWEDWPDVPDGLRHPSKAPCAVFLLGPIRVFRGGEPVVGGWRLKSLELLAYLGVHPLGAAKDQILEALWPHGDPKQTQRFLWQSVSHLRSRLGGGLSAASRVVSKIDDMYRIDLERVWVDVVVFERALRLGTMATDPQPLLELAWHLYKGEFCEGRYYGWASLFREAVRTAFVQSSRLLARRLEGRGQVDEALEFLDRALATDPHDEDLCRLAIKFEARRGRLDQVVRRFRRLRRLFIEDLDIEPSNATTTLVTRLTAEGRY